MRKFGLILFVIFIILIITISGSIGMASHEDKIYLKSRTIEPAKMKVASTLTDKHLIVQFDHILSNEEKAELKEQRVLLQKIDKRLNGD